MLKYKTDQLKTKSTDPSAKLTDAKQTITDAKSTATHRINARDVRRNKTYQRISLYYLHNHFR